MTDKNKLAVLFVCMGNICRSPSAEGFFRHHFETVAPDSAVSMDSAGTHGYHIGHSPDPRAVRSAAQYEVDISHLQARQIDEQDFHDYDLIIAMDEQNYQALKQMNSAAGANAQVRRMLEFSSKFADLTDVPDPYYGDQADFDYMCELLDESTRCLASYLSKNAGTLG